MGYQIVDISKETIPNFSDYKKVVVLLSDLESLGDKAIEMTDWVEQGGNVLFAVTLAKDSRLAEIEQKLGVANSSFENAYVKKIFIDKDFMIGGGKSYSMMVLSILLGQLHSHLMPRFMLGLMMRQKTL